MGKNSEKRPSTGAGSYKGYHLEVRVREGWLPAYDCGGFIVTREWQRVRVCEGVFGFRSELWQWSEHAQRLGILDYEVAIGMAAQFHAQFRQANWMLEFRLSREKVEWNYSAIEDGHSEVIDFNAMEKETRLKIDESQKTEQVTDNERL